jgi:hypothetical protein
MDFINPDDWTKLETAFTSAPRWAVMVAAGAAGALIVWWARGKMFETERTNLLSEQRSQKAGLEGEKSILEQRLKLAAEQLAVSDRAKNESQSDVQILKMAIGAKADNASLVALAEKVEAATSQWATANNAVSSTLSAVFKVTEAPDIAHFTVDTNKRSNNWSIEWQQKELDKLKRAKDQKAQDH